MKLQLPDQAQTTALDKLAPQIDKPLEPSGRQAAVRRSNHEQPVRLSVTRDDMPSATAQSDYFPDTDVLNSYYENFNRRDTIENHPSGCRITTTFQPRAAEQEPASFTTQYRAQSHSFIVETVFRGDLPSGAGTTVVGEHFGAVKEFGVNQLEVWKINNRETKNAVLDRRTAAVRPERFSTTPLGKMCHRVLIAHAAQPGAVKVQVDADKAIDITLPVSKPDDTRHIIS